MIQKKWYYLQLQSQSKINIFEPLFFGTPGINVTTGF